MTRVFPSRVCNTSFMRDFNAAEEVCSVCNMRELLGPCVEVRKAAMFQVDVSCGVLCVWNWSDQSNSVHVCESFVRAAPASGYPVRAGGRDADDDGWIFLSRLNFGIQLEGLFCLNSFRGEAATCMSSDDLGDRCLATGGRDGGRDLDDGGKGRNFVLVQQKQHVVTRRADVAVGRRGDGDLFAPRWKTEKVDALILIEGMRHGRQADPGDLTDFVRRRSFDVKCLTVSYRVAALS